VRSPDGSILGHDDSAERGWNRKSSLGSSAEHDQQVTPLHIVCSRRHFLAGRRRRPLPLFAQAVCSPSATATLSLCHKGCRSCSVPPPPRNIFSQQTTPTNGRRTTISCPASAGGTSARLINANNLHGNLRDKLARQQFRLVFIRQSSVWPPSSPNISTLDSRGRKLALALLHHLAQPCACWWPVCNFDCLGAGAAIEIMLDNIDADHVPRVRFLVHANDGISRVKLRGSPSPTQHSLV
jgi:hypothetical protein